MESSILSEGCKHLDSQAGALQCYYYPLNRLPASRLLLPLSGLERSDFVLWPIAAADVCDGTSAVGESRHRIPGACVGQPTEPCLRGDRGRPRDTERNKA